MFRNKNEVCSIYSLFTLPYKVSLFFLYRIVSFAMLVTYIRIYFKIDLSLRWSSYECGINRIYSSFTEMKKYHYIMCTEKSFTVHSNVSSIKPNENTKVHYTRFSAVQDCLWNSFTEFITKKSFVTGLIVIDIYCKCVFFFFFITP